MTDDYNNVDLGGDPGFAYREDRLYRGNGSPRLRSFARRIKRALCSVLIWPLCCLVLLPRMLRIYWQADIPIWTITCCRHDSLRNGNDDDVDSGDIGPEPRCCCCCFSSFEECCCCTGPLEDRWSKRALDRRMHLVSYKHRLSPRLVVHQFHTHLVCLVGMAICFLVFGLYLATTMDDDKPLKWLTLVWFPCAIISPFMGFLVGGNDPMVYNEAILCLDNTFCCCCNNHGHSRHGASNCPACPLLAQARSERARVTRNHRDIQEAQEADHIKLTLSDAIVGRTDRIHQLRLYIRQGTNDVFPDPVIDIVAAYSLVPVDSLLLVHH